MVFTVQCPNPKCRKFMLVEDRDRHKVVTCLLCKTPVPVGSGPTQDGVTEPAKPPAKK